MNLIKIDTDQLKEIKSTITPSVIIFFLWLIFQKTLAALWLKFITIVELWPDKDYGYLGAVTFFLSLIVAVSYVIYATNKGIKFGRKQVLFSSTLTVIYFIYRLSSHVKWMYIPINHLQPICFSDIVVFIPLSQIVIEFWIKKDRGDSEAIPNKKFLTDIPIELDKYDLSGRYAAAINLKEFVSNTDSPTHSFALAINGNWGSGKTSFLKTVHENLSKNTIKFWFNPWNKTQKTDLTEMFLDELKKNISVFDKSLNSLLTDYTNAVIKNADSAFVKAGKDVIDLLITNDTTIECKREKVNEAIIKQGKKIIVFIDDIDRLDKKEVFEVLRLIRNVADFSNVFFICAFDRAYVIDAIKDLTDYNKEFFLEKIFQFEMTLPPYPPDFLISRLHKLLEANLSQETKSEFKNMLKDVALLDAIKHFEKTIRTPRDCVRFLNHYSFWGPVKKKNIFFPHLYLITFISVKYPKLIELIYERKREVFVSDSAKKYSLSMDLSTISNDRLQNEKLLLRYNSQDESKLENLNIYTILTNEHSHYGVDLESITYVTTCLKFLFDPPAVNIPYATRYHNMQFPINSTIGFYRYWIDTTTLGELSTIDFINGLNENIENFKEKIDIWCNFPIQASQLYDYFTTINLDSRKVFENQIQGMIYYFANENRPYVSTNRNQIRLYYKSDGFANLLGISSESEKNFIVNKAYRGNFEDFMRFVKSILSASKVANDFVEEVIFSMLKEGQFDIVSRKDLVLIIGEKLKRIIAEKQKFDIAIFHLYMKLIESDFEFSQNAQISIKTNNVELNELFKSYLLDQENIYTFLNFAINLHYLENKYTIQKWVEIIFESVPNFISLIETIKTDRILEFISFYNKLMSETKTGKIHETLVDFNFEFNTPYDYRKDFFNLPPKE